MVEFAIIGAGIAGLAAAHRLGSKGCRSRIFEARRQAGGLLAPIVIDGFTFDTAVHLSFASEPEVREVFDKTPYFTHNPESWCWDAGYWLKHPVQTNMYPLPAIDKTELIAGLASAVSGPITSYKDWLVQQYGEPIAVRWPLRYTEKYWTIPAERLGTDWVGQRMRKADLKEVLAGAFSAETPNHYYVKEMRYPKQGGYEAFIRPMIEEADIAYDHGVEAISLGERTIRFANGLSETFGQLVSTMPLPRLIDIIDDVPDTIRADAATLFATSIDLISVGFRRPKVSPALWFYIYDEDILAARAYSPDWKSPLNVPDGCSALQFEIYSSRENPQNLSIADLKQNTIDGIAKMGIATSDDIIFIEHNHVRYANVVFDLGMEERRNRVRDWVESQGIVLAGRFGEWDYLWSNQSCMSGFKAAERAILRRSPGIDA